MAFSFMFSLFALFIFLFRDLLKFFESEKWQLSLDPLGTLGWPYIGETFQVDSQNPSVFLASKQKRYGSIFKTRILGCPFVMISSSGAAKFVLVTRSHLFKPAFPASEGRMLGIQAIFFSQGQYHGKLRKLVLRAYMPKAIKSVVSNIKSIAKESLITAFQEMKTEQEAMIEVKRSAVRKLSLGHVPITSRPGLVDFPKSMKKLGRSVMKARPFALTLLLLSAKAEGKTPTLEYGIIGKAPPSKSTHPPPVNDPTRGCNAENYCRHFTLSAENPRNSSGTRVEAFARVNVGAPLNSTAPGLEAIAGGIAKWSLKDTKSRRLRVLMNATADADSTLVSQLKLAVCRGIAQKGLDIQYSDGSISSEEMAALSPADGNITITVGAASDQVDLKFMTHVESFGETDVKWILEYAKATILAGGQ